MSTPTPSPATADEPADAPSSVGPIVVEGEPVTVTAELVAGFGAAVRAPEGSIPVTLAAALTEPVQRQVLRHPDLQVDLARTLHTEQAVEVHRPLVVGEVVTARATVTGVRPTRGGRTITFATVLTGAQGEPVQTLATTLLTAAAPEGATA